MASASRYCPSCLSTISRASISQTRTSHTILPSFLLPIQSQIQVRTAVQSANAAKYKRKDAPASQRRKKAKSNYDVPDLKNAIQFSLVDAMRYLRAAEVGRNPTSSKYEIHLRLKTPKNGAVVRNRLRLPHPVKTDLRICVIANPDSPAGKAAKEAGAHLVGEEEVFEAVKEGKIDFDRCICHADSLPKLGKSGVARILGPRGLMPSAKLGTVVKDVASTVRDMVGGSEYRERMGTVRLSIGQLGFTPEQMQKNIRTFIENVKKDIAGIADKTPKDIHEVVLSSTNGPGLSLNGDLRGQNSVSVQEVSGAP
ncbi:50S ribosomal protein L1 [Pseudocercospora fuligena]|uniref:50S ribosomal protein L1 n=1 Tax=Pseudocercospora fuligena TaxID=685502 RepID=A0A8H6R7M1_9PEZI|nr:50S ribosomal protein L1 [Pseudocercospora fuligena]